MIDPVLADAATAPVSAKMNALPAIADKDRRDGRLVRSAHVERARAEGADDRAIRECATDPG